MRILDKRARKVYAEHKKHAQHPHNLGSEKIKAAIFWTIARLITAIVMQSVLIGLEGPNSASNGSCYAARKKICTCRSNSANNPLLYPDLQAFTHLTIVHGHCYLHGTRPERIALQNLNTKAE